MRYPKQYWPCFLLKTLKIQRRLNLKWNLPSKVSPSKAPPKPQTCCFSLALISERTHLKIPKETPCDLGSLCSQWAVIGFGGLDGFFGGSNSSEGFVCLWGTVIYLFGFVCLFLQTALQAHSHSQPFLLLCHQLWDWAAASPPQQLLLH